MAASNLRKRRGVVRRSVTKLDERITELENTTDPLRIADPARQLLSKLQTFDTDFKKKHFDLIDLIDESDETTLEREQVVIDKFDDDIVNYTERLEALIKRAPVAPPTAPVALPTVAPVAPPVDRRPPTRKMSRIRTGLDQISRTIETAASDTHVDHSLLAQCQEEILDYKKGLIALYDELCVMDMPDDDGLFTMHTTLERELSTVSRKLKSLLVPPPTPMSAPTVAHTDTGVKLPKLDVPTFDGNLIHWKPFWEQFAVAVHNKRSLSNAEKTVYLQHAIKDGSAKNSIEGLSHSGDNYDEAIECLQLRYDRPRLIQRTHVQLIVDAPPLKEGNGRELRRLHDTIQQHARALKTLGCEVPETFLTSMIELKLDVDTLFEWQKHSQTATGVPHFHDLLQFIDLRAQASEASYATSKKQMQQPRRQPNRVGSFAANSEFSNDCVICKTTKHPLYACNEFKAMSHDGRMRVLKVNRLCVNCLGTGHFKSQCKSVHRCKVCQRPHHTMLHSDSPFRVDPRPRDKGAVQEDNVSSHATTRLKSNVLLMTSRVLITSPDGSTVEARALIDNASSSSFISERLAHSLSLPRMQQSIRVSGIGGLSHKPPLQSVTSFQLSSLQFSDKRVDVTAIIVPKVTCDLPMKPVTFGLDWTHLSHLPLADPSFGRPGRIDILLGADIFVEILGQGRRKGPAGSPTAFETDFGWVLCGDTGSTSASAQAHVHITAFHTSVTSSDDILRKFWEIEESPTDQACMSVEERTVVRHFESSHTHSKEGRFIVPLPKDPKAPSIGESRSQAVKRFLSLERSLNLKNRLQDFNSVMMEYIEMGHAEAIPEQDLEKPPELTFYLPMHAVYKATSTTTKIRAVFDASAKSSTGVSLNDTLLVGPTVHPNLIDVLLRFRLYPVALTADVSKMYRAIELTEDDKDLHRFVWRSNQADTLKDYRMTRVTFGVSASSFAANMALKQNAINHCQDFPLAAEVVHECFYVDDCLTGANDTESALLLQQQLTELFSCGGFVLRKWNSSDSSVLKKIPEDLRDRNEVQTFSKATEYSKTLGIEWNTTSDTFHLNVSKPTVVTAITKRNIVSDVAKVFDALGLFSPVTIKMKILLQRLWEVKIDWDDLVPESLLKVWMQWRMELPILTTMPIPRCYSPVGFSPSSTQLHGFSDASEEAYAGVIYLRLVDSAGTVHTALVTSKTRVAPIKRLSIPRLELCGALLLTKLICHVKKVLNIPVTSVFAWTDSSIVLSWLIGNPRRFKTYVGNRVSSIIDEIPPDRWRHVPGVQNPADCASRGLFPNQLKGHQLWWKGPHWLLAEPSEWPEQPVTLCETVTAEERETLCNLTIVNSTPIAETIIPTNRFSDFTHLKRVTAWILRFIDNLRATVSQRRLSSHLAVSELRSAEEYWLTIAQKESFTKEIDALKKERPLPKTSKLLPFRPTWDKERSVVRVGGRISNSTLSYSQLHPVILDGKHPITKLIIRSEHLRLMHAGPTLLLSSLNRKYHIIGARKTVRSITRQCITCRRHSVKPHNQQMGQLPIERVTVAAPFERSGVDYAGPFLIKYGHVRKPTIVKTYICLFVCLAVKAVHLELVSDMTTEAFIAALRRFIARRGCPSLIWSDHGSNFVGAKSELKAFYDLLSSHITQGAVSEFCSSHGIEWKYIPEKSPHFGGIWESAVKSAKKVLRRVLTPVKLTFEEFTTVLTQVESCLNSRPLTPVNLPDDDGIVALTPGHFLIGKPLLSLPDPQLSYRSVSLLKRWHLCQHLVRHFWERWYKEYLCTLNKYNKWRIPSRNIAIGDVVLVQETGTIPTRWPLARVIDTHPGQDKLVRAVTVKTSRGIYRRPVSKIAVLIPMD